MDNCRCNQTIKLLHNEFDCLIFTYYNYLSITSGDINLGYTLLVRSVSAIL